MDKLLHRKCDMQASLRAQLSASLRALRVKAGLRQEDVAKYLQISRSAYAYYETGITEPSIFSLYALCRFYKVPMESLFTL